MSLDYDLQTAELRLATAKQKMRDYCSPDADPDWYLILEKEVGRIIRRDAPELNFGANGSPDWYVKVFSYLSEWIDAEYEHSKLLARKLARAESGKEFDE